MTSRELYEQHLAAAAPGTDLAHAMDRVMNGTASVDDLLAFAKWELWNCIYSLPPEAGPAGGTNNSGEVSRVVDGWHASACAARAESAIRQLETLLKGNLVNRGPR